MRSRYVAAAALAAGAVAGLVLWRRRGGASPRPAVQLGLSDGSVHALDAADPDVATLERLADAVRRALLETG